MTNGELRALPAHDPRCAPFYAPLLDALGYWVLWLDDHIEVCKPAGGHLSFYGQADIVLDDLHDRLRRHAERSQRTW